jgi:glycosyltransferase involved in cell wall biosynthesis
MGLMAKALVSIVMPSYNQAVYLEKAIQSVLAQSYPSIEIIVIDAASTDGSKKIIERYSNEFAYWQSKKDRGQTDAINQGFEQATGKYLAWLNADDQLLPEAVEQAVEYLEQHPETGLVYGRADYINASDKVIGEFPAAQTDYARLMKAYVHIPQQAAFWRADLWREVGPLDPEMFFAMDYDLWVRLAKVSEIKYLKRKWGQFRLHGDSKTMSNDFRAWEDMLRVHAREGGAWLSVMRLKYWLRLLARPFLGWRRRSVMRQVE